MGSNQRQSDKKSSTFSDSQTILNIDNVGQIFANTCDKIEVYFINKSLNIPKHSKHNIWTTAPARTKQLNVDRSHVYLGS